MNAFQWAIIRNALFDDQSALTLDICKTVLISSKFKKSPKSIQELYTNAISKFLKTTIVLERDIALVSEICSLLAKHQKEISGTRSFY